MRTIVEETFNIVRISSMDINKFRKKTFIKILIIYCFDILQFTFIIVFFVI